MRRRYCKEMLMLMFHGIFGDQILNQQKKTTNKLRVLNSAAPIISNTCKFDRDSLISGEVSYTGWTLLTRFGSEPAFTCSGICTTWLLDTCPLSANRFLVFLVATTCCQLTAVTWTSLISDWLHMADMHLLTAVHQTGTHFLPASETIVYDFQAPP